MPTAAFVVNRKRIRHVAHLHRRSVAAAAARGWEMELLETRSGDAGHGVTREAGAARSQPGFAVRGGGGGRAGGGAGWVGVGKVGWWPGGFVVVREAGPEDGVGDVGILAPAGPFGWPRVAWRVLPRSRHDDAVLERYQARRVEITA